VVRPLKWPLGAKWLSITGNVVTLLSRSAEREIEIIMKSD
jgi:hypothetical protein